METDKKQAMTIYYAYTYIYIYIYDFCQPFPGPKSEHNPFSCAPQPPFFTFSVNIYFLLPN